MGNCQAIDAAALVIQHPCGRIERLYWSISASEVMRLNPGHYVSLIIPLPISNEDNNHNHNHVHEDNNSQAKTVRFTRVKLLRPSETLALGHAYRLVTTQEVMKVLRAKKYAKAKKQQVTNSVERSEIDQYHDHDESSSNCDSENYKTHKAEKSESHRQKSSPTNGGVTRSKSWRPSLKSISESGS